MIAFLLALLLWSLGSGPAPTPHGVTVSPAASAPAIVAPAPDSGRLQHRPGTLSLPSPGGEVLPAPAGPTVAAPPLDPAHPEYAPQNPGEVIGRQIDCPDGSVGVMDAAGAVSCPGPARPAP